jgi:hypothetical protein
VSDAPDTNTSDNTVTESIFVDLDTDGDGIPNRLDKDQDNDGLTNEQEQAQSTNQLKSDTDGDGVNDKQDFYPLDPTKTKFVPPPPPVPAVKPTPKAVIAPPKPTVTGVLIAPPSVTATNEVVVLPVSSSTELGIVSSSTAPIEPMELVESLETIVSTSTFVTSTLPISSPYRFLWAVAGATAGAALGFVALDWWNSRRRRIDD